MGSDVWLCWGVLIVIARSWIGRVQLFATRAGERERKTVRQGPWKEENHRAIYGGSIRCRFEITLTKGAGRLRNSNPQCVALGEEALLRVMFRSQDRCGRWLRMNQIASVELLEAGPHWRFKSHP